MSTVTSALSGTGYKKDSVLSSYSDPKSGQTSALCGASRMAVYTGKPGSISGLTERANSASVGISGSALAASRYMVKKARLEGNVQKGAPAFLGENGCKSSLSAKSIFPDLGGRAKVKSPIGPDHPQFPAKPDSADRPSPPSFCPHNGSEDTTISDILRPLRNVVTPV